MKKSLLIITASFSIMAGHGMAVTCGRFDKVSAGEDHSLTLADNQTLWACGGNNWKQLGLGSEISDANSLQQVLGENGSGHLQNIITFDAGWKHSLAADSEGVCYSWGTDIHGQLGNGSGSDPCYVPRRINGYGDLGEDTDIVYVSAGRSGEHSLVVDSNGYVYGFGFNNSGQCGDGTKEQKNVPVLVLDDTNTPGSYLGDIALIVAVDAGVNHSLALDSNGFVWEWGANNGYSYPQKVPGLHSMVGISTCEHSVAVDSNGFVYEWVSGNPYKVPGGAMGTPDLENIDEVSAGLGYSLARTNDGRVLFWYFGNEPVYVEDGDMNTPSGLLEGIVSIAAGYYDHKLAVSDDGYGWAWGNNNNYGKFGVGDYVYHLEPTQMVCDEPLYPVVLIKTDDVNDGDCVDPFVNKHINYQIFYDMNGYSDSNIFIKDILPEEVNYSASVPDGNYNPIDHTVTWGPWNLTGDDSNTITLIVEVTERAEPYSIITNTVKMYGDTVYKRDTEETKVCCYLGNTVFVDCNADPNGDGLTWDTAFKDLQTALAFVAAEECYDTIYVAAGTYQPVNDIGVPGWSGYNFELLNNIGLFGHFAGTEESPDERVLDNPEYETTLQGLIDPSHSVDNVVTADDISGAVLDGFTIKGLNFWNDSSVLVDNNANIILENCKIRNNGTTVGLKINNSSTAYIHNCTFFSNGDYHIALDDNSNNECDISYCNFDGNDTTGTGIYSESSMLKISDSYFTGHTNYSIDAASSTELTVTDSNFIETISNSYNAIISSSDSPKTDISGCTINNNGYDGDGIYCSEVDNITITDCTIQNAFYGLHSDHSTNKVFDSHIFGNSYAGIYAYYGTVHIERSYIYDNDDDGGIYLWLTGTSKIFNNWIYENSNGIYLHSVNSAPEIRNNTIAGNTGTGIKYAGETPPEIKNCIIWNPGADDLSYCTATYSCIKNPDDASGAGNIAGDANNPQFYNLSNDDYHLTGISPCIDIGTGTYDENDIDGEDRVVDGDGDGEPKIDMGADEFYWPKADYNRDEIVNFIDFSYFADKWFLNDPCISLDTDPNVNIYDLALFCKDWLWFAPWGTTYLPLRMGGGGMFMSEPLSPQVYPGGLMLPDISESLDAMPDSLYSKVEKFYAVSPNQPVYMTAQEAAAIIAELLDWLDELWESGDVKEYMTYEQYIEFRESIKESIPLY